MLLPKQKVVLVVRTFLNTSKNILSTLTMPLFLSGVVVWNVIRMVGESDQFVIKTLFSMSSLGTWFYEFMEKCYGFVMKTPLAFLVGNGKNEVSYFSAFCVVVSLIYIAYALYKERIGESIRQYHRRMNYYLKMNQGIYMENKKYSKVYRFTTGFIVLVFAIGVYIGLEHIYQVNPYAGMPEEVQISAKENLPIRDKKYIALEKYAKGKKHYIATLNEPRDLYLKYDVIKEKKNSQEPYLMMRTYPLEADAKEDMKYFRNGAGIHWKHHKKLNIDYYISKDGFVIRDHSIIIVMQNTRYFATPYGCIQPLSKEISLKDIKSFVKKLGYNL